MTAPRPALRIKKALERAAELATARSVIVEVSAGNVTYRVIPDIQQSNPDGGRAVDATDDIRF